MSDLPPNTTVPGAFGSTKNPYGEFPYDQIVGVRWGGLFGVLLIHYTSIASFTLTTVVGQHQLNDNDTFDPNGFAVGDPIPPEQWRGDRTQTPPVPTPSDIAFVPFKNNPTNQLPSGPYTQYPVTQTETSWGWGSAFDIPIPPGVLGLGTHSCDMPVENVSGGNSVIDPASAGAIAGFTTPGTTTGLRFWDATAGIGFGENATSWDLSVSVSTNTGGELDGSFQIYVTDENGNEIASGNTAAVSPASPQQLTPVFSTVSISGSKAFKDPGVSYFFRCRETCTIEPYGNTFVGQQTKPLGTGMPTVNSNTFTAHGFRDPPTGALVFDACILIDFGQTQKDFPDDAPGTGAIELIVAANPNNGSAPVAFTNTVTLQIYGTTKFDAGPQLHTVVPHDPTVQPRYNRTVSFDGNSTNAVFHFNSDGFFLTP